MKKLLVVTGILFSLSSVAETIQHKNCELYVNTQSIQKFLKTINTNSTNLGFALRKKGYQALVQVSQLTMDRHAPMSGDIAEDILSGDFYFEVINPKSVKLRFLFLDNKKNDQGYVINTEFMSTETVISYKKLFQDQIKFYQAAGVELINQIPDCQIVR